MAVFAGGGSPTMMRLADGFGKMTGLVSEDNGNMSSSRVALYGILGLVWYDVMERGKELNWIHLVLVGSALLFRAVYKFIEKPQQGVVDSREAKRMVEEAAAKAATTTLSRG